MADIADSGTQPNEPETAQNQPGIIPMDSFERIEAEILQEAMEGPKVKGFTEDYSSMEEETTFDEQIASARGLRKQSNLDELAALDLQWKLEHQQELAEKALERLEVAALIKKAEEKLLPGEEGAEPSLAEESRKELARETEELSPELVMLDNIISSADLLRMESSDLSDEEGFRLRLSCILEESESDSGSGVFRSNKLAEALNMPAQIASELRKQSGKSQEKHPTDQVVRSDNERIAENNSDLNEQQCVKSDTETPIVHEHNDSALESSQKVAQVEKQTSVETEEFGAVQKVIDLVSTQEQVDSDNRLTEDNLSKLIDETAIEEDRENLDSVGSSSPEPNFGIQRLKSGTKVDQNLAKPLLKKRLESSSDSSLDLSTATTSPSVEDAAKSLETVKAVNNEKEYEIIDDMRQETHEAKGSGSSQDISIQTCSAPLEATISKSVTPDNVRVEMENSNESVAKDNAGYNIREVTDEEIQAIFPKIHKRVRGKSEEKEVRQRSDSQSIKSFDLMGAASRLRAMLPKMRKTRRGISLESGMAEKKRQEQDMLKRQQITDSEERTQKEKSEPPPVPPETYLWEELRRWRIKGGYPWTHLDKAPFDEKTWKTKTDHEYEPVNPPQETTPGTSEPVERNEDVEFNEAHFLRIPRDDELVVSPEDMEVEAIGAARQLQDELEERFLATPMTATTASRTDCDVNTSMLDSSGLEDLPLKRGSRSKKALQSKTEQMRAQAQGLQQRIRSQAGKLRNKLRSLPRPSFPKKERPREDGEEKPPRFRMPDRPKFSLPERPKFNLPERPKFKMPQKPKLSLQSITKPLRERQGRAAGEPKKGLFEMDFKTYPRLFNKKSKDRGEYATSSPKMQRSGTPPPAPIQPARKKVPVGQRWVNRFDDIKYVDDRASELSQPSGRSDRSESLSGFHDRDFAITDDLDNAQLPPPRAVSTKSSISRSEPEPQSSRSSVDRHEKGVLEEIDSDQFFLRQKGISEDDINMEKYLSEEIREAFRSPVVNALRSLDMDYEGEIQAKQPLGKENVADEPLPPSRTRSLKKGQRVASVEEAVVEKATTAEIKTEKLRYQNLPDIDSDSKPKYANFDEDSNSEYYKSPPSPLEYHHYKVPRPTPVKRKSASKEKSIKEKNQNGWVEVEIETDLEKMPLDETPQTLPRRKSKKITRENQSQDTDEIEVNLPEPEPDYIVPESNTPEAPKRARSQTKGPGGSLHSLAREEDKHAPIPPKRTSSKSIHTIGLANERIQAEPDTQSVHSLAFDERRVHTVPRRFQSKVSRSFQSLPNGEVTQHPLPPERTRSLSRASKASLSYSYLADDEKSWMPQAPTRTRSLSRKSLGKQTSKYDDDQIEPPIRVEAQINHYEMPTENGYADYAVVEKVKPPRPPPPRRRKGSRSPVFSTFPRRSPSGPTRPVRNYATLGPSRPPRKARQMLPTTKSVEHIYSSGAVSQSYAQIENNLQLPPSEDLHGSNKDLQATDVVEKMKVRPLPAPPRPPRLKTKSEEQNVSMEIVEEVCAATQTDPLPDDVCLEDDIIQEFSHEQLRMQEAFLKEMREEEERIQSEIESKRARHMDVTVESEENEAKMEIIRQMGDIIQEERRLLEDDRRAQMRYSPELKKTAVLAVEEDDMGYASLDRRQPKVDEPQASTSFQRSEFQNSSRRTPEPPAQLPTQSVLVQEQSLPAPQAPVYIPLVPEIVQTERLRVGQLEVDRLCVAHLEATNFTIEESRTRSLVAQDIQGVSLQVQDVNSHSGNLTLRNIDLPPEFLREIISRIPWEDIRPPTAVPDSTSSQTTAQSLPKTPTAEDETVLSSHSSQTASTRRRRRHHRTSRNQDTSEEETDQQLALRRPPRHAQERQDVTSIGELSQRLVRACTSATVNALNNFAQQVAPPSDGEARTRYVQVVLLVAMVAIAGYLLLGWGGRSVHHHHWDFQFPPQPDPPRQ